MQIHGTIPATTERNRATPFTACGRAVGGDRPYHHSAFTRRGYSTLDTGVSTTIVTLVDKRRFDSHLWRDT